MNDTSAIEDMRANADDMAVKLKAMANRDRLLMLCRLSDGEASVGELVDVTGISQSLVSQHLATLRDSGVVTVRADKQMRIYSITDDRVRTIFGALCDVCQVSQTGQDDRPDPDGEKEQAA
ncbi:metalloregulator ArsR/SmtB family transcription factor [Novosphingobium sp. ZN18A2]|uniref:ArsR/SmtB family transcription factor n=1 Tax=Novosphingobium sp. ZN18A2 TaxID=3079861 RepID=UPI0030CD7801